MKTYYIRFVKTYMDPVWGMQAVPWIRTPLVRVTRNHLSKAHFEWVGNTRRKFDLALIRSLYPLVIYPVEEDEIKIERSRDPVEGDKIKIEGSRALSLWLAALDTALTRPLLSAEFIRRAQEQGGPDTIP